MEERLSASVGELLATVRAGVVRRFFAPRWPAARHPLAQLETCAA